MKRRITIDLDVHLFEALLSWSEARRGPGEPVRNITDAVHGALASHLMRVGPEKSKDHVRHYLATAPERVAELADAPASL